MCISRIHFRSFLIVFKLPGNDQINSSKNTYLLQSCDWNLKGDVQINSSIIIWILILLCSLREVASSNDEWQGREPNTI